MEFIKARKFSLSESIDYVENGVSSRQILRKAAGNITLFSFAEGEGLSEHSAPFDALVQIIEGESEIVIDGKKHRLQKNELIILPANIPHSLTAVTNFKMMLVMIRSES